MMNIDNKIIDRIRKLGELRHSSNEHEAAIAAARMAEMMSEHAVTEAMLQVTGQDDAANAHVKERITHDNLPDAPERRVAWRDSVASAVASSVDCETYYMDGKIHAMGRKSNVSAWQYMCAYLFAEIARLADEAWLAEGADLAAVGQTPRSWKGAFRLGAGDVIANRLYASKRDRAAKERTAAQTAARELSDGGAQEQREELTLVRVDKALDVIAKDRAEVKERYQAFTKGWRSTRTIGAARGRSGYSAGREAGQTVKLTEARAALKGGK